MELKAADDEWWPYLAIYQISYYIIVITILLNLIFGIIIDTFSQYGLTHPYLALHGLASLRLAPPCQLPTRPPARPFATCLHRHRLRTEKAEDYM
jgi:hypothetical protein